MIERILPACACSAEALRCELHTELFVEEQRALGRAVEKRRREFVTGRACARSALAQLGIGPAAIPSGERGEPCWPGGVVGSITHCDGYRACAVARTDALLTVGIDAEPDAALPSGLLSDVASPAEIESLERLRAEHPRFHWDRLLFSAKESVYKAWFPLAHRWLGFDGAQLEIDRNGSFEARLLVPGPFARGRELTGFQGRWMACDGIVITAIALSAS